MSRFLFFGQIMKMSSIYRFITIGLSGVVDKKFLGALTYRYLLWSEKMRRPL